MTLDRIVLRRYLEQNAAINCTQFVADGQRFNFVHATNLCSKRALSAAHPLLHRESKKGATLTTAVTSSVLDRFAKFFHCCKEH